MKFKSRIFIITGPTASGKTTLAKALVNMFQKHGKKSFLLSIEPFCGLSFLMIFFLTRIIVWLYPIYRRILNPKGLVAFLEIVKPKVLSKLLTLLITMDNISLLTYSFIIQVLLRIKYFKVIVLEDFIPQAIADHIMYGLRYGEKFDTYKHTLLEILLFGKILKSSRPVCIHLYVPKKDRIERILQRDGNINLPKDARDTYNEIARDKLVRRLLRELCYGYVFYDTIKSPNNLQIIQT